MFSKKGRLNKELIKKILKQGKSVRGRSTRLRYLIIPDRNSSFSFVVSVKVAKNSVERNKLKRRARAIVLNAISQIKKGFLGVILFEKESKNIKFSNLSAEIIDILKKAGALELKFKI